MGAAFYCEAPAFHDGDNIRCGGRSMRLAGIDAPDYPSSPKCQRHRARAWCSQSLAEEARLHLVSVTEGRRIHCRVVDASPFQHGFQRLDPYGRPVVRCRVGKIDLSEEQLRSRNARRWPLP